MTTQCPACQRVIVTDGMALAKCSCGITFLAHPIKRRCNCGGDLRFVSEVKNIRHYQCSQCRQQYRFHWNRGRVEFSIFPPPNQIQVCSPFLNLIGGVSLTINTWNICKSYVFLIKVIIGFLVILFLIGFLIRGCVKTIQSIEVRPNTIPRSYN